VCINPVMYTDGILLRSRIKSCICTRQNILQPFGYAERVRL